MRRSLLESFDKIYILDLHGNSKKKETAADGSADQNVFDIMQGVSINLFVKTKQKKKGELGELYQYDLQGKRSFKYDFLNNNSIKSIDWNQLKNEEPNLFFVKKDFSLADNYEKGFKIDELMSINVSGFQTKRDKITIQYTENDLIKISEIFINNESNTIRNLLKLPEDGRDWTIDFAKNDLLNNYPKIIKVMYRPFDDRFTFYTGKSKGFIAYPRNDIYKHLNSENNISIITCRQLSTFDFQHVFNFIQQL